MRDKSNHLLKQDGGKKRMGKDCSGTQGKKERKKKNEKGAATLYSADCGRGEQTE